MFGLPTKSKTPVTVLITGSSRGIGLAAAQQFLREGNRVAIFCRHPEHIESAVKALGKDAGTRLFTTTGDVRNQKDVDRIVSEVIKQFGQLDVLVNNAGVGLYKTIETTSESEWDGVLNTNLKGYFLFTRAVIPHLRKNRGGIIINISSGLGVSTEGKYSAYSASKFGIMALTKAASDELKADGIRVYAVMPGGVATKLHLDMHPWEKPDSMMQPQYIAEKITWLARSGKPSGYELPIYS